MIASAEYIRGRAAGRRFAEGLTIDDLRLHVEQARKSLQNLAPFSEGSRGFFDGLIAYWEELVRLGKGASRP